MRRKHARKFQHQNITYLSLRSISTSRCNWSPLTCTYQDSPSHCSCQIKTCMSQYDSMQLMDNRQGDQPEKVKKSVTYPEAGGPGGFWDFHHMLLWLETFQTTFDWQRLFLMLWGAVCKLIQVFSPLCVHYQLWNPHYQLWHPHS